MSSVPGADWMFREPLTVRRGRGWGRSGIFLLGAVCLLEGCASGPNRATAGASLGLPAKRSAVASAKAASLSASLKQSKKAALHRPAGPSDTKAATQRSAPATIAADSGAGYSSPEASRASVNVTPDQAEE